MAMAMEVATAFVHEEDEEINFEFASDDEFESESESDDESDAPDNGNNSFDGAFDDAEATDALIESEFPWTDENEKQAQDYADFLGDIYEVWV